MKHAARFTLIVLVLHVVLFAQTGPKPPDLPMIVQRAALIVDATVQSAVSNNGGAPNSVRQDVVFSISRVLKGTLPPGNGVLILHRAGNRLAGTIPMQTGERYILFLQPGVVVGESSGPPQFTSIGQDNSIKIDDDKLAVNPDMPLHGTHNGKGVDEFLLELQSLIKP